MQFLIVYLVGCFFASTSLLAQSTQLSYTNIQDESKTTQAGQVDLSAEARLFDSAGMQTSFTTSATQRQHKTVEDQISKDRRASVGLSQGLAIGTSIGANASMMQDLTNDVYNRAYGANFTQWWYHETFQTSFNYSKSTTTQPAIEHPTGKGISINLPSLLKGESYGLNVTQLTTPTTILLGNYSYTVTSDRPAAQVLGGEVRQYLEGFYASLHLGLNHYENIGQVKPITQYGSVISNSAHIEFHKQLGASTIAMIGYRLYLEQSKEIFGEEYDHMASDWYYSSLRFRFGSGSWVANKHEFIIYGGRYLAQKPENLDFTTAQEANGAASMIGTSLKFVF